MRSHTPLTFGLIFLNCQYLFLHRISLLFYIFHSASDSAGLSGCSISTNSISVTFLTSCTGCICVVVAFVTTTDLESTGVAHRFRRRVVEKLCVTENAEHLTTCLVAVYHFKSSSVCLSFHVTTDMFALVSFVFFIFKIFTCSSNIH